MPPSAPSRPGRDRTTAWAAGASRFGGRSGQLVAQLPQSRERNEVRPGTSDARAFELAVHPFAGPVQLGGQLLGPAAEPFDLVLHLQDHLHPGEVDPVLLGQPLDHAESGDVSLGVPAGVPGRTGRLEKALALVDAERLGVHPGQLGGHADHVDSPLVEPLGSFATRHPPCLPPASAASRARGEPFLASTSRSSSSSRRSSFDSLCGTSTRTVTSRSPAPPFGFGEPFPRTRNVLPLSVPAGIFRVTGPFRVGTSTFAPRAASAN